MSAVIECLIVCDGCGANSGELDKQQTAAKLRASLKMHEAWLQRGRKDYCESCACCIAHGHDLPNKGAQP